MYEITFRSRERSLVGRLFRSEHTSPPYPGILFVHGLESSQEAYHARAQRVVQALDAAALTFDLSGHGLSEGPLRELTPRDHLHDVVAAYDLLAGQDGVDAARIGVCGASYGGYLSAQLLSRRPVWRLLLRAPALYDDSLLDVATGEHPEHRSPVRSSRFLDSLRHFTGSALVLESERDEVISPETIQKYVKAFKRGRHRMLPGAGHALMTEESNEMFIQAIIEWFGTATPPKDDDREAS